MGKFLFIIVLATLMLTACGSYEDNPQTGKTEYHGTYSNDETTDIMMQTSVDTMLYSTVLN